MDMPKCPHCGAKWIKEMVQILDFSSGYDGCELNLAVVIRCDECEKLIYKQWLDYGKCEHLT